MDSYDLPVNIFFFLNLFIEFKKKKNCFTVIVYFRDVFPYGIYMLTYDQLSKTLANSEWILEKKKESPKYYSYAEVLVPIFAGATAGKNSSIFNFFLKISNCFVIIVQLGFLSWIWVIPFDVMKTIMQAEIDPTKHRQMSAVFKKKTNVSTLISIFANFQVISFL